MRLLLQRVREAAVHCEGNEVSRIGPGLLVLAGFGVADGLDLPSQKCWSTVLKKLVSLRIFPDTAGKMNRDVLEHGGQLLVVSQFTLYADLRSGRRPSFTTAAPPEVARTLYERLLAALEALAPGRVCGGVFGGDMDVSLVNWGPVTMQLDTAFFGGS
ncbi:D-aminoacyl-tRNA deacylase [Megalodesulfovibrio paquesii]